MKVMFCTAFYCSNSFEFVLIMSEVWQSALLADSDKRFAPKIKEKLL